MNKLQMLDPRDYYQKLSKKDKSNFLMYLSKRYDYRPCTISGKLRANSASQLRRDERENIIRTIQEDLWRV